MKPIKGLTGLLLAGWWSMSALPASATEELPEVLRYARQYVHTKKDDSDSPSVKASKKTVSAAPAGTTRQLARAELMQRQQQLKIDALEKRLQELLSAQQERVSEHERLVQERDIARENTKRLEEIDAQRRAQVGEAETSLKQKADEVNTLNMTLAEMKHQLAQQISELETLKQQATEKPTTTARISLTTLSAQQAYATGVMFARDVREAQEGNRLLGVELDPKALMAGLNDELSGQKLQLTPKALAEAGQAVEEAAGKGYQTVTATQKKQAEKYLKTFLKQKGVIQDEQGFWSLVTYSGDGELLQDEDVVDVVVEEALTDGTVVSDMERSGSSLRQTVQAFPPVFAAGLKLLRNHGQIIQVVPPELAYGERGYPPSVPPGATMVYRIRVSDVVRQGKSVQATAPVGKEQTPPGG